MPYKNDNLEELFRNAAENYPLKTNNSNWSSIAAKLNNANSDNRIKKDYRFIAYAIFAFVFLGGAFVFYKHGFKSATSVNQPTTLNNKEKSKDNYHEIQDAKKPVTANVVSANKTHNVNSNYSLSKQEIHQKIYTNLGNMQGSEQGLQPQAGLNKIADDFVADHQNNRLSTADVNTAKQNIKDKNAIVNPAVAGASKNIIQLRSRTSRFYGSLYGGPEFSMVKFQHLTNSGYQLGVSLGYRVNNRFDVEIGLQREHINYYTNGKYFEKSGLKLQDPVALENVYGKSKITSVPVTLKYNFSSHSYSHFYATAGVDAIMLTHTEKYNFVVSKNGDENNRSKKYSSVTSPKYFTAINAGAGYETKLSNWCNMKIEPYYQLPIANIGVGKVPVTSFGINIGIVKNLR